MDVLSQLLTSTRVGRPRSYVVEGRAPWGRRYPSVAGAGIHVVLEGQAVVICPDGDPLTVSAVTKGANGSVTNNVTDVTYTPDAGFCDAVDTFTYTVDDGNGGTDVQSIGKDLLVNRIRTPSE
jgi:hypothetical protein